MHLVRPSALALLALAAPSVRADTIHTVTGEALADVDVQSETLKEVEYRPAGKSSSKTIASDQVLAVEFSKKPPLVDRAEEALKEDQYGPALNDLNDYVDGYLSSGRKERMAWAPAYAAHKAMRVQLTVGNLDGTIAAADRLIQGFPDSRYVPYAFLTKAQAQTFQGKAAAAQKTLQDFATLVQQKGLSEKWRLRAELELAILDPTLKGDKRLDKLRTLAGAAGSQFPTVRNRATLAEAETQLEAKKFDEAEKLFRRIVDDPKADDATLAGAYTGLGDCLFQSGATKMQKGEDAKAILKEALLSYLRVVVSFPDQTAYVPRAMFFAGRVFDLSEDEQDKEHAQDMYLAVIRQYRGTDWATEAKNFRK